MTSVEKQQMMTTANIPKLILKLSIPTIISMLVTSIYSLVDTYFVGQVGTAATAAVGIVFPLMNIMQAFGFFFGHGSGNAISRRLGVGNDDDASRIASCGLFCAFVCGILIATLGNVFLRSLAILLGSTKTILPYAMSYLRIILLGAPIMCGSFVLNNQLRFQGNAVFSMVGVGIGAVVNMFLDPLLILHLDMGVTGAAVATVVGQFIGLTFLFIGYKRANCISLKFSYVKYLKTEIKEIFSGGLPSLLRQSLMSIATITLNLMVGSFGDPAIAAMSIVARIVFFANAVVIGCGQGFQPVCGFNYGAGDTARVKKAFWFTVKLTTALMIAFAVMEFTFSEELIALFRRNDPDVISIGAYALRLQCLTLPLLGWVTLNNMMFQTCNWTIPATILASARQGLCFIPVVLILPVFFGLFGVQLAQPISDILSFVLSLLLHLKLIKKLNS